MVGRNFIASPPPSLMFIDPEGGAWGATSPIPSPIFALASVSGVPGVAPVSSGASVFSCFVGASHPTVLAFILAFESSEHMFASTEVPVLFSFASSISSGSSRSAILFLIFSCSLYTSVCSFGEVEGGFDLVNFSSIVCKLVGFSFVLSSSKIVLVISWLISDFLSVCE